MLRRELTVAIRAILFVTVLLGVVYPLAITAVGQVAMPNRASGSLIEQDGKTIGASGIGQDFAGKNEYFQSRPSVTGYSPNATYFPNLGPNSSELSKTLAGNLDAYLERERQYNPGLTAEKIPADAVTESASGVDPAISPVNAGIQAARIANVRQIPLARINELIAEHTESSLPLLLGEDAVNVLELNLALDAEEDAR